MNKTLKTSLCIALFFHMVSSFSQNTNYGTGSLSSVTTGIGNSAFGNSTLFSTTTGSSNSALGWKALYKNVLGSSNSALGVNASYSNYDGLENSAFGNGALSNNVSGSYNSIFGSGAGANISNDHNCAFGVSSLGGSGGACTAMGAGALQYNTTGFVNCAYGATSLQNNMTGNYNVAVGQASIANNISGSYNVGLGTGTLFSSNSSNNVAVGYQALTASSSSDNTAVGYKASYNFNGKTGSNDALGSEALLNNHEGISNVAIGHQALYSAGQSYSTAVGYQAAYNYLSINGVAAFGYHALYSNDYGQFNSAFGTIALEHTTKGGDNTAMGSSAMNLNVLGKRNTGIGSSVLYNSLGDDNTAGGYMAGASFTNDRCTFLGSNSDALNALGTTNSTAVGYSATVTSDNFVQLGDPSVLFVGSFGTTTMVSDGRFKKDISQDVPGLKFIKELRPVTYHYDVPKIAEFLYGNKADNYKKESAKSINAKSKVTYTGFIAQEVEISAKKIGYDFSGIKSPQNEKDMYGLGYAEFVVPLVKGMQEQQGMIEVQAKTIAQQQEALSNLMSKMEILSSQLNDIKECCSNGSHSSGTGINNTVPTMSLPQLLNAVPNPASNSTVVYYYVPSSYNSAKIQLTNVNGEIIQTIDIISAGYSSCTLQLANVANAIYNYSLIVDGKIIDSKKLSILLKN